MMELLEVGEVAARLGVSALRVRQLAKEGRLPVAVRTARRQRLFDAQAVETFRRARERLRRQRRSLNVATT